MAPSDDAAPIRRVGEVAKLDLDRSARTGIPEVVLADAKRDEDLVPIVAAFVAERGRILVSRLAPERVRLFEDRGIQLEYHAAARILVAHDGRTPRLWTGGRVAVLAAGTADVPVAEEARVIAEELGCDTVCAYDVGVAGIHRLFAELPRIADTDVVVACAGREAALGPVVGGLVDQPVIGVPTSVGYGFRGGGESALSTMLQSCSPIATVNIDAGFTGGALAAQIANRVARARGQTGTPAPTTEAPEPVAVAEGTRGLAP